MRWEPIEESALWELMNRAEAQMTAAQVRLWEAIRMPPVKWMQHPYGDVGGGFWAVAIIGTNVVWFNDIEGGFNISAYQTCGVIGDYWANQYTLIQAVQRVLGVIVHGFDFGPFCGPPISIAR